jgi:hypothetical protein
MESCKQHARLHQKQSKATVQVAARKQDPRAHSAHHGLVAADSISARQRRTRCLVRRTPPRGNAKPEVGWRGPAPLLQQAVRFFLSTSRTLILCSILCLVTQPLLPFSSPTIHPSLSSLLLLHSSSLTLHPLSLNSIFPYINLKSRQPRQGQEH